MPVALLSAALFLGGCGGETPAPKAADAKAGAKAPESKAGPGQGGPVPARVLEVSPQRVPIRLESVGQVEGSREVEVRARVGGIVLKRLYNEGEIVKAGAPLFQIDPAPFEIALAQTKAQLAQERARNEQSRRESVRLKELAAQKAISQREYDDAASNLKLSEASIQVAEARVSEAELNLSYTRVNAPLTGVTGRAQRSEGSLVSTTDSLLTTISQIDPVWTRFALSEPEVSKLPGGRLGGDAEIRLILGDGSRFPTRGKINFSASQVDARLGTRQMRAEFENSGGRLLPGQFVRIEVSVNRTQPAFLVPQAAVLQNEKGHFVFTLNGENKAAVNPIAVGEWVGEDWTVLSGLKSGDRVVLDNLFKMQPGVAVQPLAADAAKPPADGKQAGGK